MFADSFENEIKTVVIARLRFQLPVWQCLYTPQLSPQRYWNTNLFQAATTSKHFTPQSLDTPHIYILHLVYHP
jgi:hypothetical protein